MSVFVNDGGVEKEAKMIYVNDGGVDQPVAGGGILPAGDAVFTTPGTYSFLVLRGVIYFSSVCIGAGGGGLATIAGVATGDRGGGGGGGALAWCNVVPVTPGETLTVIVGAPGLGAHSQTGNATNGGASLVRRGSTVLVEAGGGSGKVPGGGTSPGGILGTSDGGSPGGPGAPNSASSNPGRGGHAGVYTGATPANPSTGSPLGGSGRNLYGSNSAIAAISLDGADYGGGGSGLLGVPSSQPGGNGAPGAVRVVFGYPEAPREFPNFYVGE